MLNYLIKRILLIIPTLIIISVISFFLSRSVPQDQTTVILNLRGLSENFDDKSIETTQYANVYKELSLDKPSFYFSILPNTYPRNISAIIDPQKRRLTRTLLSKNYNSESIDHFISTANKLYSQKELRNIIEKFYSNTEISTLLSSDSNALKELGEVLLKGKTSFFYPKFYWNGFQNQYHKWVSSLFDGSFGISIADGLSALVSVKKAFQWTIVLGLLSIFLTFGISLLIGTFISYNPDGKIEHGINLLLFAFYAIPVFWLATMMVMYFTTDDYGQWTNIFPSIGINIYPGESTFSQILKNWSKFILPVLCVSLHSIAYIARILRRSILNEMKQPYILTAFSKGLTKKQVVRKHALPNALLPFITLFVGAFPTTLAGALIIEVIFNIPGIGRLMYNAIGIADWNVVFCILMIIAVVTIVSYLIGDILYALLNPKVRLV